MLRTARRLPLAAAAAVVVTFLLAAPAGATWSIDGVDPDTGEVGVAVASCVPFEVGRVAVVVPGKGAASSQADISTKSGAELVRQIQAGAAPADVVKAVTAPSFDAKAPARQFGVVVAGRGGAGYSGKDNSAVSVDRRNAAGTASAQGNILTSPKVVDDALAAFDRTTGTLADKLLAALKAGSAAGGDSRCREQTASSATLVVAKPGDPVWQRTDAPVVGDITKGKDVPSVFVSVLNRKFADNAVDSLTAAYRSAEPVDGKIKVRAVQAGSEPLPPVVGVAVLVGIVALVAGAVVGVRRLLRRRRQGGAPDATAPADTSDVT